MSAYSKEKFPVSNIDWVDTETIDIWDRMKGFMTDIRDNGNYTHDFPLLQKKKEHFVFVYGTLKKGFKNERLIKNQKFCSFGYTKSNNFIMTKTTKTNQIFPVCFWNSDEKKKGRIFGELYKVTPKIIRELDYLESNGLMYKRVNLEVDVLGESAGTYETVKAFMYIGRKEYWHDKASILKYSSKFIPNQDGSSTYYCFTKKDEIG